MREPQDRKLWDKLLTNLAPTGRNVFGLLTGDEHRATGAAGQRHTLVLMEQSTADNLRASMEAGALFEVSPKKNGIPAPVITKITAGAGKIAIEATGGTLRWISDGKEIAAGSEIVLADCAGLGAYVRAEVQGEGGTLYTQPFLLSYDGMPAGKPVPADFFDDGIIVAFFRQFMYPVVQALDTLWKVLR